MAEVIDRAALGTTASATIEGQGVSQVLRLRHGPTAIELDVGQIADLVALLARNGYRHHTPPLSTKVEPPPPAKPTARPSALSRWKPVPVQDPRADAFAAEADRARGVKRPPG